MLYKPLASRKSSSCGLPEVLLNPDVFSAEFKSAERALKNALLLAFCGLDARNSAIAPATCGEAMEVPDSVVVPPPLAVDRTETPGAAIATGALLFEVQDAESLPQFDQLGQLSLLDVALTVIAESSNAAGAAPAASAPLLPAATA